jgi:thiosulfate/3-mercaptopyruvate sulfurtransferase
MKFKTIISAKDLARHIDDPGWITVDCRFSLSDTESGRRDYGKAHIPGSVYAHLDDDLSGQVKPGITGRHPLPAVEKTAELFSSFGIGLGVQVVAYDDAGGALAAARLWWMLRWLGHEDVAVLDGGWQTWKDGGYPVQSVIDTKKPKGFNPHPRPELIMNADDLDTIRLDSSFCVIDSRAMARYRGEIEPIDPVAGHIPGAVCAPYQENLHPNGKFLSTEMLKERFQMLLGDIPANNAVFYWGSGVTSIHNILAMMHTGLGESKLYVGSWSDWITDPDHPVSTRVR